MTTGPQTNMDELQMQKQGRRLVFQIFPEPVSDSVKTMCGWEQEKKRLPSIIVEATEATELAEDEGGALRWPPQGQVSFDEEEDPFVDQSVPSTSDNIRKKNEKDMSGKKGAAKCRCAQSVEPGQLDFSRLTPPSSPTDSEAMPACLRSPPGSRREGRLSQLRQGAAVCGVSSPRTWSIPLPALPTWLAQLPESDNGEVVILDTQKWGSLWVSGWRESQEDAVSSERGVWDDSARITYPTVPALTSVDLCRILINTQVDWENADPEDVSEDKCDWDDRQHLSQKKRKRN
ncbi:uncharacterized protein LOC114792746 isoform X2 [Denticeps clupeoides]|uniref:uncharacterized protein LOC114792746 isoform X2 n=1 Tax=Denticeps clupeoides TaxID=299321 RepID=UPI0010A4F4A4|nr:uncharacterized protein LOC114792746 isoform X2 [Denticeps clupeoides]